MNGSHQYGDVVDNQLRSLNHIGVFTTDIGEDYSDFPRLPDPLDEGEPLESRARSYLDADCANCHRPGGSGRTNMDLRFDAPLESTQLVNVPPTLTDAGAPDAKRVSRGLPDRSVLYLRLLDLGDDRMPPLASSVVDREGAEVVRRWIESLADGSGGGGSELPGDFTGDGTVDFEDFLQFAVHFGRKRADPGYDSRFDLDGDGRVGFEDFLRFVPSFGRSLGES